VNTAYEVSKLFDKAYKVNVANKSTTDIVDMMYNTATLKSEYSLTDIDTDEMGDEDAEPPEENDNQDQAKLFKDMTEVPAPIQKTMKEREIAPLDALYHTMRVFSNDEKQQTLHKEAGRTRPTGRTGAVPGTWRGR
jgi:hypothetical protein